MTGRKIAKKQVRVQVHFEVTDAPVGSERLWATEVEPGIYKIENIPLFAYGVALGDVVRTRNKGGEIWFASVVRSQGNSTIRILFSPEYAAKDLLAKLHEMGCGFERSRLLVHVAVNVPPTVGLDAAETLLAQPAADEQLSYEVSVERRGPGTWSN